MTPRHSSPRRGPAAPTLLLLLLAVAGPARAERDHPKTAGDVLAEIQAARVAAGLDRLEHRPDLDRVARLRATQIAGLPQNERLAVKEPIETTLSEEGVDDVRRVALYVGLKRGYLDYASAFVQDWRDYEPGWRDVISPSVEMVGLSIIVADDEWVILVALLAERMPAPAAPAELESEAFAAVNETRVEHGLNAVVLNPELSKVARAHSADMARRHFFDHRSPDGENAGGRVRGAALTFTELGENLHKSRGTDDPVETAVSGWLASPHHRETMLTESYVETGVGVAIADDGTVYFTQLFRTP